MTNLCLVSCKTQAGEPCWFPFYYNGTEHYECITDDNDGTGKCYPDPGKICSLFSVIMIMTNLCLVQCKTTQNHTCIFPVSFKETMYYECWNGKSCPYEHHEYDPSTGQPEYWKWWYCVDEC